MTIDYFRQFLTVAEYRSFSVAAEALFITQSALSRHIALLEEELNIKLFDRTTQSVALTPAGELFKTRISALINDYDDICSRLRIMKDNFNNRLRIGVPYYAISDYLGPVPEIFERTYPDVKLLYSVGDPHEVTELLYKDQIDIALLPKYPVSAAQRIVFDPVFEEPLGVLMNSANPLAIHDVLPLSSLRDETFFSVDNQYFSKSWSQTAMLCRAAGFTPRNPAIFNQMEALIMAIRRGDGVAVIGRHMRNQQSSLIAFRPLADSTCHRTVCICHKKDNLNAAISKFRRLYKSVDFSRDQEKYTLYK